MEKSLVSKHPEEDLEDCEEDHSQGEDRQGTGCLGWEDGVNDIAEVEGSDDAQDVEDDAGQDGLEDGSDMGTEEGDVFQEFSLAFLNWLEARRGGKEYGVTCPFFFEFFNGELALAVGGVGDPDMFFVDSIDDDKMKEPALFALVGYKGESYIGFQYPVSAFQRF